MFSFSNHDTMIKVDNIIFIYTKKRNKNSKFQRRKMTEKI